MTTASATPVTVSGGLTFASVIAGYFGACGVTTGGAAYCWGANGLGQLGNGTTTTASTTPVPVSGGLTFTTVSWGLYSFTVQSRRAAILAGVRASLEDGGAVVWRRFTFGGGATGLSREAYYAGWETVGELLREGMSFHEIATLNPADYAGVLRRVIDRLANAAR